MTICDYPEYLAVGFLYNQNIIQSAKEVKEVEFIEVTEGLTHMSGINDGSFKRNINIISNNQLSKTKSLKLKTVTLD